MIKKNNWRYVITADAAAFRLLDPVKKDLLQTYMKTDFQAQMYRQDALPSLDVICTKLALFLASYPWLQSVDALRQETEKWQPFQ